MGSYNYMDQGQVKGLVMILGPGRVGKSLSQSFKEREKSPASPFSLLYQLAWLQQNVKMSTCSCRLQQRKEQMALYSLCGVKHHKKFKDIPELVVVVEVVVSLLLL